jgi:hypothetical protein
MKIEFWGERQQRIHFSILSIHDKTSCSPKDESELLDEAVPPPYITNFISFAQLFRDFCWQRLGSLSINDSLGDGRRPIMATCKKAVSSRYGASSPVRDSRGV